VTEGRRISGTEADAERGCWWLGTGWPLGADPAPSDEDDDSSSSGELATEGICIDQSCAVIAQCTYLDRLNRLGSSCSRNGCGSGNKVRVIGVYICCLDLNQA